MAKETTVEITVRELTEKRKAAYREEISHVVVDLCAHASEDDLVDLFGYLVEKLALNQAGRRKQAMRTLARKISNET